MSERPPGDSCRKAAVADQQGFRHVLKEHLSSVEQRIVSAQQLVNEKLAAEHHRVVDDMIKHFEADAGKIIQCDLPSTQQSRVAHPRMVDACLDLEEDHFAIVPVATTTAAVKPYDTLELECTVLAPILKKPSGKIHAASDFDRQTSNGRVCAWRTGGDDVVEIEAQEPEDNSLQSGDCQSNSQGSGEGGVMHEHSTGQRFEVLFCWKKKATNKFEGIDSRQTTYRKTQYNQKDLHEAAAAEKNRTTMRWRLQHIGMNPLSPQRSCWDMLSLFFVMYDMFWIPMGVLEPPASRFSTTMDWISRVFWTCDMPLCCITGHLTSSGKVIADLRLILLRYGRTWFLLDFMLVCLDWMELVWQASGTSHYTSIGRTGRVFRFFRMLRLLRAFRCLQRGIQLVTSYIRSERLLVAVGILKIFFCIVACGHLIACAWYGVCRQSGPRSWLYEHVMDPATLEHKYLMALHWSLSQFAGGMDEIQPKYFSERIFTVSVFPIAWMMAIALSSSMTSDMTRLHILASKKAKQIQVLNMFLVQNKISDKLSMRVKRNAQYALNEKERLTPEEDVELLDMVSDPIKADLHFEMFSPVLELHPFFSALVQESEAVMKKLCHNAARVQIITAGDTLFDLGELPENPRMYILCSGVLYYFTAQGRQVTVQPREWIAEAGLWTEWTHHGTLKATHDSRVVTVDATTFQHIMSSFGVVKNIDPKEYAELYVSDLNKTLDDQEELTDLKRDCEVVAVNNVMGVICPRESQTFRPSRRRVANSAFIRSSSLPNRDSMASSLTDIG